MYKMEANLSRSTTRCFQKRKNGSQMQSKVFVLLAIIIAFVWAETLKAQNVQGISVSGLSAGAFFAVQVCN